MKIIFTLVFLLFNAHNIFSQSSFPQKCIGNWEGMMYIFQKGKLRDSVKIHFSVEAMGKNVWSWKTEYLSEKFPMTKNYKMKITDSSSNRFMIDEGDGIYLYDYLFNNKLYSVFETHDILLTSTYELVKDDELIFEVTSGKKIEEPSNENVRNYSVEALQRVVMKRK